MVRTCTHSIGMRGRGALVGLASLLLVAFLAPQALAAVALDGYDVPTPDSLPQGITSASDGGLWFTERNAGVIGRIGTDGAIEEFPLPDPFADPSWITSGPDGNLWFTEASGNAIGRMTPAGDLMEFALPTGATQPAGVSAGPDGAMWFTERTGHAIGRVTTDGAEVQEFPLPGAWGPFGIAAGPDGALWFTLQTANAIGRITVDGDVTTFPLPAPSRLPAGIVAGPDGALWFTERLGNRIGRITVGGAITEFPLPAATSIPASIAVGGDGALWFTETGGDRIGRMTTGGELSEWSLADGAAPYAIAAGSDGALWWTEQGTNRIGRLPLGSGGGRRDETAPTIDLRSPVDGATQVGGARMDADFSCADEDGGSGLVMCEGTSPDGDPVDVTPGSHTFSVHAMDKAGNEAWASAGYVVFESATGKLVGSSALTAGSTIPFELDLGGPVTGTLFADGYPAAQPVTCDTHEPSGELAGADLSWRLDHQGVLKGNWRTDRAWRGSCVALVLRFTADGWTGADAAFVVRFR